jgi:hypothetical protein
MYHDREEEMIREGRINFTHTPVGYPFQAPLHPADDQPI